MRETQTITEDLSNIIDEHMNILKASTISQFRKLRPKKAFIIIRPVNKGVKNLISLYKDQVVGKDLSIKYKSASEPPLAGFIPANILFDKKHFGKGRFQQVKLTEKELEDYNEQTITKKDKDNNKICKTKDFEIKVLIDEKQQSCKLFYKNTGPNQPETDPITKKPKFYIKHDTGYWQFTPAIPPVEDKPPYKLSTSEEEHSNFEKAKVDDIQANMLTEVKVFARDDKYCIADYDIFALSEKKENNEFAGLSLKEDFGNVTDDMEEWLKTLKPPLNKMILHGAETSNYDYTEMILDQKSIGEPYVIISCDNSYYPQTRIAYNETELLACINTLKLDIRINPNWGWEKNGNSKNYTINLNRVFLKEVQAIAKLVSEIVFNSNEAKSDEKQVLIALQNQLVDKIKESYKTFNQDNKKNTNKNFLEDLIENKENNLQHMIDKISAEISQTRIEIDKKTFKEILVNAQNELARSESSYKCSEGLSSAFVENKKANSKTMSCFANLSSVELNKLKYQQQPTSQQIKIIQGYKISDSTKKGRTYQETHPSNYYPTVSQTWVERENQIKELLSQPTNGK